MKSWWHEDLPGFVLRVHWSSQNFRNHCHQRQQEARRQVFVEEEGAEFSSKSPPSLHTSPAFHLPPGWESVCWSVRHNLHLRLLPKCSYCEFFGFFRTRCERGHSYVSSSRWAREGTVAGDRQTIVDMCSSFSVLTRRLPLALLES